MCCVRPDDPALKAQAIDSRLLSGAKIRSILAEPLDEPADPSVIDKVFLVAPRVTDGLYLLPKAVNPASWPSAELGNNLQNTRSLHWTRRYQRSIRASTTGKECARRPSQPPSC